MSRLLVSTCYRVLLSVGAALATSLLVLLMVVLAGAGDLPCSPQGVASGEVLGAWGGWLRSLLVDTEFGLTWSCQPLAPLGVATLKSCGLVLCAVGVALLVAVGWARSDWLVGASLRADVSAPVVAILRAPPVLWATFTVAAVNLLVLVVALAWTFELREWLLPDSHVVVKVLSCGLVLVLGGGLLLDLRQEVGRQLEHFVHQDVYLVALANGQPIRGLIIRNLAVGVLSSAVGRLPVMLGEVVIVEHVFVLDGMGRALVEIVTRRDASAMMFITLILVLVTSLLRSGLEVLREVLTPSFREVGV